MDNLRAGFLVIAIALGSNSVILSPSRAVDVTFQCAMRDGVPTTVAQTSQAEVAVVMWNSPDIAITPGATQQAECEAGSQRFQTYHDNGALPYITTGTMEGQQVVCVAEAVNGGCRGRLFALAPTNRPRPALQRILRIRIPSQSSNCTGICQTEASPYVELTRYLSGEYDTEDN